MNVWMRMLLGMQVFYAVGDEGGGGAGADGAAPVADGGGGADAGGGAGGDAGGGDDKSGAGGDKSGAADGGDGAGGGAGDGQAAAEYVADPAKTPEENAALKKTHDDKVVADKAKAELFGAPDKYGDIEVPEGMAFDQETADKLHGFAKQLGLSQKAVDALVDLQKGLNAKSAEQSAAEWNETLADWEKTVKADPALGGKDYDANMGVAAAARQTFGTPELQAWLDETKIGNHPEMVRFFVEVGKAMGEGKAIPGGKQNSGENAADILYDHPSSKPGK